MLGKLLIGVNQVLRILDPLLDAEVAGVSVEDGHAEVRQGYLDEGQCVFLCLVDIEAEHLLSKSLTRLRVKPGRL